MAIKPAKIALAVSAAVAALGMGDVAFAQAQQLERVEVTGSSIKRTEGETAAPVQVITRKDIERSGVTSTEQLIRTISATTSSGSTVAASASGATTGGISSVSLRGLGSTRTLVLVNGKRVAAYGAPNDAVSVDVDSIPISAIERVEVLKDGASAIYGSDAIAGVINFILRREYKGAEASAYYGSGVAGTGSVAKGSVVFGFGDLSTDRYNVMAALNIQKDEALVGAQRKFASTAINIPENNFGGSSRTNPGNINIPGVSGTRNPNVPNCGPFSTFVPQFGTTACQFDTAPYVTLIPETDRFGGLLSGRFVLNQAVELYGDIGLQSKKATTSIQPSPIDVAFGIPFTLTTASPFYPTAFVTGLTGGATPALRVRYRPFITGLREIEDKSDALRMNFGAQGNVAGWDYDASVLYSESKVTEKLNSGYFRIQNDASGPGIVPLLAGQRLGANGQPLWVNPFGPNSAEVEAAARATNLIADAFTTQSDLLALQGKASKELFQLSGGKAAVAVGADVRQEGYKLDSNPALATGNISGYGGNFSNIKVDRNVYAIFSELSAPVLKNLQIDAALRFDSYGSTSNPNSAAGSASVMQSFASVNGDVIDAATVNRVAAETTGSASSFSRVTGKLGARWTVTEQVLARATYGTGFRAPSLTDLYRPLQTGVSAVINDPQRCRGANAGNADDCATQFNVYSGGRSNLKPERSNNWTVGLVFEPSKQFSFGVDYYNIKVKDLIGVRDASFILANSAQFPGRVQRGAVDIPGFVGPIIAIDQRNENVSRVNISGFDFDLRGSTGATAYGRFDLGVTASYVGKWEQQNPDGSFSDQVNLTSSTVFGFIPRLRTQTALTWGAGKFTTTLINNWQAPFTDICGNLLQDDFGNCPAGSNPGRNAYSTWDLNIRWDGIRNLGIAVGARNLFDKAPPYVNGSGGAFQSGYDPTYVDPRLRFIYTNITYKFF